MSDGPPALFDSRTKLMVQIKSPEESKGPWDFVKVVATIPPDQAFRPLDRSKCSLIGR